MGVSSLTGRAYAELTRAELTQAEKCAIALGAAGYSEQPNQPGKREFVAVSPEGKSTVHSDQRGFLDGPGLPQLIRNWTNEVGPQKIYEILETTRDVLLEMGNSFRLKDDPNKIFSPELTLHALLPVKYVENFLLRTKGPVNGRAFIESKILQATAILNEYERLITTHQAIPEKLWQKMVEHFELKHLSETRRGRELQATIFKLASTEPTRVRNPLIGGPEFKDYPNSAVRGIDGLHNLANEKGERNKTVATELNNEVPSGKSNNEQILESIEEAEIRLKIPKEQRLSTLIAKHKVTPEEMQGEPLLLRMVLESNARAWTRTSPEDKDAILVEIGPGFSNSAHPDVSVISQKDKVPLVEWSDLYFDFRRGQLYLNTGPGRPHPRVMGIYAREESRQHLADPRLAVGLYYPFLKETKDLESLAQKLNSNRLPGEPLIKLENGVKYVFLRNAQNEIVDVLRDEAGRPLLEKSFSRLGRDPQNPRGEPPPILELVAARKIWISNLGGGLADGKNWQELIEKAYGSRFSAVVNGRPVHDLSTPKPLEGEELESFFAGTWKGIPVIKRVKGSSGNGVFIQGTSSEVVFQREFEKAKKEYHSEVDENGFRKRANTLVNYRIEPFTEHYLSTKVVVQDGEYKYIDLPNDVRFFLLRRHDEEVFLWDFLGRTAPPGGTLSNTGQGGGYQPVVLYDKNGPRENQSKPQPVSTARMPLSASAREAVQNFLKLLFEIETMILSPDPEVEKLLKRPGYAENPFGFFDDFRNGSVLDVLNGRRAQVFPYIDSRLEVGVQKLYPLIANFKDRKISYADFSRGIQTVTESLRKAAVKDKSVGRNEPGFLSYSGVADLIQAHLKTQSDAKLKSQEFDPVGWVASNPHPDQTRQARMESGALTLEKFSSPIPIRPGAPPIFTQKEQFAEVVAVAKVVNSRDPEFSKQLQYVQRSGAEVYLVRLRSLGSDRKLLPDVVSSDHVLASGPMAATDRSRDNELAPHFVTIDLGDPRVLAGLAHEAGHAATFHSVLSAFENRMPAPIMQKILFDLAQSQDPLVNKVQAAFDETDPDSITRRLHSSKPEEQNTARQQAWELARALVTSAAGKEFDEQNSLRLEMEAEIVGQENADHSGDAKSSSFFNDVRSPLRDRNPDQVFYLNRVTYPQWVRLEHEALAFTRVLARSRSVRNNVDWDPTPAEVDQFYSRVQGVLGRMIEAALQNRSENVEKFKKKISGLGEELRRAPTGAARAPIFKRLRDDQQSLKGWEESSLWLNLTSAPQREQLAKQRVHRLVARAMKKALAANEKLQKEPSELRRETLRLDEFEAFKPSGLIFVQPTPRR